jgi:hypothetical protein
MGSGVKLRGNGTVGPRKNTKHVSTACSSASCRGVMAGATVHGTLLAIPRRDLQFCHTSVRVTPSKCVPVNACLHLQVTDELSLTSGNNGTY